MKLQQQLLYLDKNYNIISAEHEFIVHPVIFDILPLTPGSATCSFECCLEVIGYRLQLKSISILNKENDKTSGFGEDTQVPIGVSRDFENKPISYTGTLLIGESKVQEYFMKDSNENCFSYKRVFELIFEEGNLITTIDHSRAMLRIRKNIELGYRNLTNKWDVRCITHYINSTFIGDYKPFSSVKKRLRYLVELKSANNK